MSKPNVILVKALRKPNVVLMKGGPGSGPHPGIKTTYPYEQTSPGVARHQCEECGGWEREDKNGGMIRHSKHCDSKPQPASQTSDSLTKLNQNKSRSVESLKQFGEDVRRTSMTHGRDDETVAAVKRGHLSVSDAMNTDD